MAGRPFPWTLEAELVVWCARTVVSEAHQAPDPAQSARAA
jgi:hypothetical protein